MHWPDAYLADYRALRATLHQVDPDGGRGLLAFGHTGGFNYFLERHNPSPFTQDFFFSAVPADSALEGLYRSRDHLLLLDQPAEPRVPDNKMHWEQWEQVLHPSIYITFDRPRFNRLAAGCAPVPLRHPLPSGLRLLDCAQVPAGGQRDQPR